MDPHPAPWLIATDIDGTLLGPSLDPSPRVRAALAAAQRAGHHVTLATGRAHAATVDLALDLDIVEPLICHQGAVIQRGEEIIAHVPLSLALSRELVAFAESRDLHANCYIGDRLLITRERAEMARYVALVPMLQAEIVPTLPESASEPFTKIVLVLRDEETATRVLGEAEARWGSVAQVVRSHSHYVELTNPAVSKGNAVMRLAGRLGVPRERVLAVGDNFNDLSMILAAGVGVAMGDAEEAIRAAADWVAPPLAEDGLAAAIERFVLD